MLRVVDRLVAIGDAAPPVRLRHHGADERAVVAPDRADVLQRDARVGAHLLELLVAAGDGELLDAERVGARLVEDRRLDRRVQPLNQRHHGDDRRHRHDVAEHGHERPQLGGPDRVERDARRLEELVHFFSGALLSTFHEVAVGHAAHRVVRARDDLVALLQPGQHLEILVAGDAHLDRHELRLAVAHDEHALRFLARLARLQLGGGRRVPVRAGARLVGRAAPSRPARSRRRRARARRRPESAPTTTFLRVAVVMSAVHVNPGRTSGTSSSSTTTTLKLVACVPLRRWPSSPESGCCRSR